MNKKKLKILVVYDCIYPESLGGVEHRNYQLAKCLSQKNYSITLAGWTEKSTSPLQNVEIFPLPFRQSLYNQEGKRSALTSLKFAIAVCTLPIQNYDLILTDNIPYIHLFPLFFLTIIRRKKLIITWHEYWGKYWQKYVKGLSWILFFLIEFLTAQLNKQVIAVSRFTADRLEKYRFRKNSISIIPNGVNLEKIISITNHHQKDSPPLIYVGRLIKEKRVNLLIKAITKLDKLNKLDQNNKQIILQIIGDGPEREKLERLTNELKITHKIKFTGRLSSIEEVWQQIAGAKIAIQPSEREGFGMFPLEAMAVGIPVIYCQSDESAVSEVVRDGIEGIAVNADIDSLTTAIHNLLNNEQECHRLSENAHIRSKEFDWQNIANNLEFIFYDILN